MSGVTAVHDEPNPAIIISSSSHMSHGTLGRSLALPSLILRCLVCQESGAAAQDLLHNLTHHIHGGPSKPREKTTNGNADANSNRKTQPVHDVQWISPPRSPQASLSKPYVTSASSYIL